MAGKAPVLLALALFVIGATGLAVSTAESPAWGPFQPRPQPTREQQVIVVAVGTAFIPPPLEGLLMGVPETALESGSALLASAPATVPQPAATPTPIPPLRVFGISADDGGVAAAAATPTPPPPLRIVNVASDEEYDATQPPADDSPPAGTGTTEAETAE